MKKSRFVRAYELGTRGMEAFSTGACPGCDRCASDLGYAPKEDEDGNEEPKDVMMARFARDLEEGRVCSEPHFSWSGCDICGSRLGGDREPGHYLHGGRLYHVENVCVDCIMYTANGDEPEVWEG